ncbi:MAG: hypothetical protein ACREDO_01580 [Methyloceanibacter sp.]
MTRMKTVIPRMKTKSEKLANYAKREPLALTQIDCSLDVPPYEEWLTADGDGDGVMG